MKKVAILLALLMVLLAAFLVAFYVACHGPFHPPAVPSAHPIITLAKAKKIRPGMSYRQVVGIVGTDGKLASRFCAGPFPPLTPAPRGYPEYEWRNSDGSRLRVGFHNDKVGEIDMMWLR